MEFDLHEYITHCQFCGQDLSDQKSRITKKCLHCGKSTYTNPSIGAGIVGYFEDEILLIKRARDPYANTWDIPAGFIDVTDDSTEDAIRRELFEEVGLLAPNKLDYISSASMIYEFNGIKKPHLSLFFKGELNSKDVRISPEILDYKFVKIADIKIEEFGFPVIKDLFIKIKNDG